MEKTKKLLEVQRSLFDQVYNEIVKLFASRDLDRIEILSKIQLLEQKIDILTDLHKQVVGSLLDDDINLKFEISKADEYYAKHCRVKLMSDNLLNKDFLAEDISQCSSNSRRKLKLPTIELKKFGGEIKDWLPFWSQFQRIDNDEEIAPEDKFQYLIQATIPNSRARQILESYPPNVQNYPKAIESLKSRFGRNDLLIEFYVRELLKLVLNTLPQTNTLSYLYDKMECQLRALETLQVTSETCAAMLYPLVESCLPENLIRVWQRSNLYDTDANLKDRLDNLMNFLKKEVENEERITLATSGFDVQRKTKKKIDDKKHILPTASGLINNKLQKKCHFCSGNHSSEFCTEAKKWSLFDRKKKLIEKACCYNCLKYGHISKKCRVNITCTICNGKHHAIMCPKPEESQSKSTENPPVNVENNLSNSSYSEVFLQTCVVNINGKNKSRTARIIIDTGSQKSYITKSAAEEMGYDCMRQEEIIHALFGGSRTNAVNHNCYCVRLSNIKNDYACNFEALDQSIICSNIACVRKGPWMAKLKSVGIEITDIRDGPIDVLIGADIAGKLLTGNRYELKCGLVALETLLGWTLMGKLDEKSDNNVESSIVMSMFTKNESISNLWDLDVLGIGDPVEKRTQKETERIVMEQFLNTITRKDDGRYEVCMSWVEDHPPLSTNYGIAKKRLDSLVKRLYSDGYHNQYDQVFKDWLVEGIIEEVPDSELVKEGHYLPHRHVVKENNATTKIRPVFDASAREKNYPSLNQCLEKGINLIELIPSLLIKFRLSKFGLISDIRKAFLQISLCDRERDFLRFLWFDEKGELKTYRHTRVVFGVTCSPFLLGAVIDYHLNQTLRKCDSYERRSIIVQLLKSFYVDNCVTSLDSKEEIENFIQISTEIFAQAKFDLRGWEHTSFDESSLNTVNSPVLGLRWNKNLDTLQLNSEWFREVHHEMITKRVILSIVHRLFDPIGFSCPVSLCPKILLQKTWKLKTGWDTELQEDIRKVFLKWFEEIPLLLNLKIPRWYLCHNEGRNHWSLHVFCDASQQAYATAIFLRSETYEGVHVQLVQAKCRVSPVKQMTIPRLELLAATIGARLSKIVREAIDTSILVYWWSDSTTVLSWIKDDERWKPFVWNRVEEIRILTNKNAWYHVPGHLNPADLPSRGCSPQQLIDSRWWEGPQWLRKSPKDWPIQSYVRNEEIINAEKGKGIISTNLSTATDSSWYHERISSYQKIIRVVGWIKRFIANCRNKKPIIGKELCLAEVESSEKSIIKLVQNESFKGVNDPQLNTFCPYMDEDGVIRIRTKVSNRDDLSSFLNPIILPSKHPIVNKLIYEFHMKSFHVGVQSLLGILRERYWIIKGRRTVKSVISKCIRCRRFNAKCVEVPSVPLPLDRVRRAHIFEVTGLDLTGPLYIRSGEKVWICLYTCAIFRAVHLELLSSLSTDIFLQSFRRFVARRGRPSIVYSDNGTNFIGAENAFSHLDWKMITVFSTAQRIKWKFNPPTAAWWGGWWERLIGIIKALLRKVLGRASLTYEELATVLCDCESILNSRPLTYVNEDSKDLVPLSPDMFLKEIRESGVPDMDAVESTDMRKHLRYRMKLKEDLRKRFRNEYLGQLKLSPKKQFQRAMKVGDIVLIGNDNSKRLDWPLACIEELIPGRDNKIRLVKLRTAKGSVLRPLQRIYPLEMNCSDDIDVYSVLKETAIENKSQKVENEKEVKNNESTESSQVFTPTTRYGRKIKPVQKFSM